MLALILKSSIFFLFFKTPNIDLVLHFIWKYNDLSTTYLVTYFLIFHIDFILPLECFQLVYKETILH